MNQRALEATVNQLIAKGKGILAADETPTTIGKRFQSLHIDNTAENRRQYRQMLFHAQGIEQYISGVILQEETLKQKDNEGNYLVDVLKDRDILGGIKVDKGLSFLDNSNGETYTQGLDTLEQRLKDYKRHGVSFAKWRAVIHMDANLGYPTPEAIERNAVDLATYARICQELEVVPIVEPEVLMDGHHSIDDSYEVTSQILKAVFYHLKKEGVYIPGMLLKPNMVIPGLMCSKSVSAEKVAEKTLQCFQENISSELKGIVFLSGGMSDEAAALYLNIMNKINNSSWVLSFSYGRALQRKAILAWKGQPGNVSQAQQAFLEQAHKNSLASMGQL